MKSKISNNFRFGQILHSILKIRITKKLVFFVVGFLSTIWFLIRVIPKPSRASYPCMRATAPLASSFIAYLLGLFTVTYVVKKFRERFMNAKYFFASICFLIALTVVIGFTVHTDKPLYAKGLSTLEGPNLPMGVGKGIFPGRVVWIYNPAATNENMTNTAGDYWSDDNNTNQDTVSKMFSESLKALSGKTTDAEAWTAIFKYYNKNHNKGDVGYAAGEKIVIKINFNGAGNGPANINTCPQICYALLNQLVNTAGVAQTNISIGDPNINFTEETWNKCHTAFPNIKYWGSGTGRTNVVLSNSEPFITSDGVVTDYLPQAYLDAAYMINMPVLKKHHRGGISLTSKNHFGSLTPYAGSAFHVHYSLPCPDADGQPANGNYGSYRCFVDIMGNKNLGGKTILYIIDGLWSSVNWGHPPIKWRMAPFNNDWPSSIFMSQDPVAIESVGFDFLYKEFDANNPTEGGTPTSEKGPFPHFPGVDDFLHQAADPANWPSNLDYAPNGDGVILKSLGTHEHWNNALDKQYSRNLGLNKGIELYQVGAPTAINTNTLNGFLLYPNSPNPFNQLTTIRYMIPFSADVELNIYNLNGQLINSLVKENKPSGSFEVKWYGRNNSGLPVETGYYLCKLLIMHEGTRYELTNKMLLLK